jgi:hypothetical protein
LTCERLPRMTRMRREGNALPSARGSHRWLRSVSNLQRRAGSSPAPSLRLLRRCRLRRRRRRLSAPPRRGAQSRGATRFACPTCRSVRRSPDGRGFGRWTLFAPSLMVGAPGGRTGNRHADGVRALVRCAAPATAIPPWLSQRCTTASNAGGSVRRGGIVCVSEGVTDLRGICRFVVRRHPQRGQAKVFRPGAVPAATRVCPPNLRRADSRTLVN